MTKKKIDIIEEIKLNKEEIDKILEDNKELFMDLAWGITCPMCKERIRDKQYYNLGEKFNSFEGCEDCFNKL